MFGKCAKYEKCEPHSKILKSYDLGRGWGDSSEKKMMKEILRNGLVTVDIKWHAETMGKYKSGILSEKSIKDLLAKLPKFKAKYNSLA